MVDFLPWWERYPGRLEHELTALQSLGITAKEDPAARASGIIEWIFEVPGEYTGQGPVQLVVTFPEFYPFLRPDVTAPDLDMAHHQHPFGKNLCLIGRASASWDTGNDLAWLIREQLQKALDLGASHQRGGDEEDQGEPFSDYYNYQPNAMVLLDSAWSPPAGTSGGSVVLKLSGRMPLEQGALTHFVIDSVADDGGKQLFNMPPAIAFQYKDAPPWKARWTHIPEPVRAAEAEKIWASIEALDKPFVGQSANGIDFALRLVSFPEEHSQTTTGTGWILLVQQFGRVKNKRTKSGHPARQVPQRAPSTFQLVRSGRVGLEDMRARLEPTSSTFSRKVLLLGAGAIGSVIADQLARSGIDELTVIDHDVLEPGNLVRHASNLQYVGGFKSGAACALANQVNPYLHATAHVFVVGGRSSDSSQRELLSREFDKADVVIDATAEVGVQRLSASLAQQAKKPWIGVWATNGAVGGTVLNIPAGAPWCFSCFEWTRAETPSLKPPASAAPLTQPIGCAEPTFVGAGYNLNEVSIHAARTAMAVLDGKPRNDVAVLSMNHPSGAELPQWEVSSLTKHEKCLHN